MKKTWLSVFAFLFFLLSVNISFAQTATSSSQPEIKYDLPYPGLLPDSPLYFLRVIRDGVVGLLISDPLKKAEFDLLQADKRLNAGIFLVNKGKTALALSTISKAENYFEEGIGEIGKAKQQGEDAGALEGNLRNALAKHKQEITILAGKVAVSFKPSFEKELKRVMDFDGLLNR